MSDGGMHASFNGLSSIRSFFVDEITAHLTSLRDKDQVHLARSTAAIDSDSSKNAADGRSDSQSLFLGLIEAKIERYQAAIDVVDQLANNEGMIRLDISRDLSLQILKSYVEAARALGKEGKAFAAFPEGVKQSLKL